MNVWQYLERYKVLSATILLWTYLLVTWVVYRVFDDVTLINAAVTSALGTVIGIPAAAVALFKWRRGKADDNGST